MRILTLVPFLLLLLATGCSKNNAGQATPPPPQVDVAHPVVLDMRDHAEFTGRTQAINGVTVQARVGGYLDVVCVGRKNGEDANPEEGMRLIKEGTDVKKGEILFVIERRPFEIALDLAKKTLDQNKVQRDYNKRNYDRNVKAGPGVAPGDLDASLAAWQTSETQVGQAEANLRNAQQNLDWATIRAPFDGRISKRLVDRGIDVKADTTNLCVIEQVDPLYAFFDVDERTLLRLGLKDGIVPSEAAAAKKSPVGGGALFQIASDSSPAVSTRAKRFPLELALSNEPVDHYSHTGVLEFADNRVDPSTGTLRMWGLIDNPDRDLKSGMFVRVRMGITEPKRRLFVDERALNSDQGRKYLYIVVEDSKDGEKISKIDRRDVEVGQRMNGMIAVEAVKAGSLTEKDLVVVTGLQTIRKGIEVQPTVVPMPAALTAGSTSLPLARGSDPGPQKQSAGSH
jgi:RND family efflux transporter MFP subunit